MKRLILIYLGLLAGAAGADALAPVDRFNLIGPGYKSAREVPSTLFNPFKSQSNAGAMARKETASVSNEMVAEALTKRGVSGVVISPDAPAERVVLGDEVFGVGDELTFPSPKTSLPDSLVAGATVVLSAIRAENLEFEIRIEGEPARRLTFPLHSFWTR